MDEGDEETGDGGGGGGDEWQMRFVVLQVQVVMTLLIISLLSPTSCQMLTLDPLADETDLADVEGEEVRTQKSQHTD